jgi:5-methylcytosine-specific restriction endonuclease McrA
MHQVLLLNMGYEPFRIISWRRALGLILRECVYPATTDGLMVQGVTTVLHIPYVLRLKKYVNVPISNSHWTKRGVLRRDQYTCIYCGAKPGDIVNGITLYRKDMTIDHIIPKSRQGANTWINTACACRLCNQYKGNKTPDEANLDLFWLPSAPRTTYWEVTSSIPTAWRLYLETDTR